MVTERNGAQPLQCGRADLLRERALRGRRDHKVDGAGWIACQPLDDSRADRGAGGAADAHDDAVRLAHVHSGTWDNAAARPSPDHIASTRAITAEPIVKGSPQVRSVSGAILVVASMPSLPPRPDFGEAKSRESIGVSESVARSREPS